jgi:hypothetical protein
LLFGNVRDDPPESGAPAAGVGFNDQRLEIEALFATLFAGVFVRFLEGFVLQKKVLWGSL